MDDEHFSCPEITDADIAWVSALLGLSQNAFTGPDGNDSRQQVLTAGQPMDIAACPGSGKTTLLVAKLAILASKWEHRTRGICVLSHTNAARREIETRLGSTRAGNCLLTYPHFVGTIHAFVDEFLAVPWLRSLGYPVTLIDTEICEHRRWSKIEHRLRHGLRKRHVDQAMLRLASVDFSIGLKSRQFPFGDTTDTYIAVRNAFQAAAAEGYHCYDDMFLWAHDLLDHVPVLVTVLRSRFPLLFVDEAQDNSETQSAILNRIFAEGDQPAVRQRFGDPNQAIYDFLGGQEATTDRFPDETIKVDVPNSHRFGQGIADIADPLGLAPYDLVGLGPRSALTSGQPEGRHTILVFDAASVDQVLGEYGELLLETFSDDELADGVFTALGQVHKETGNDHLPRHVGHYWPNYDPSLTRSDPKPHTFVQCILAGQAKATGSGETHSAVNRIAEGVLRLAEMAPGESRTQHGRHSHRQAMRLLENDLDSRQRYERLIQRFAIARQLPTESAWDEHLREDVRDIAEAVAGTPLTGSDVERFLGWPEGLHADAARLAGTGQNTNIYKHVKGSRSVSIRVGSIHSAKGETHTATLVLETFWYKHNIEDLMPWLDGSQSGGTSVTNRQQTRLKTHYVAMTRPTHLLCLAMKCSTMDADDARRRTLEARGWEIRQLAGQH